MGRGALDANKASHGNAYCIAPSPPFHSRACWLALNALAPVFVGVVFGRGLAVVFRQNTAASQSSVFADNSVFRLPKCSKTSVWLRF